MSTQTPGVTRILSLIKIGGVIHRGMDSQENPRCAYCWDHIVFDENDPQHTGTLDHVYSEGSDKLIEAKIKYNEISNLVPACRSCNSIKGAGTDEEWDSLEEQLRRRGIAWKDVLARLANQMNSPIDDLWGKFYAEKFWPRRRANNLEYGRRRSLEKRYGEEAPAKRQEIDARKANQKKPAEDIPF